MAVVLMHHVMDRLYAVKLTVHLVHRLSLVL